MLKEETDDDEKKKSFPNVADDEEDEDESENNGFGALQHVMSTGTGERLSLGLFDDDDEDDQDADEFDFDLLHPSASRDKNNDASSSNRAIGIQDVFAEFAFTTTAKQPLSKMTTSSSSSSVKKDPRDHEDVGSTQKSQDNEDENHFQNDRRPKTASKRHGVSRRVSSGLFSSDSDDDQQKSIQKDLNDVNVRRVQEQESLETGSGGGGGQDKTMRVDQQHKMSSSGSIIRTTALHGGNTSNSASGVGGRRKRGSSSSSSFDSGEYLEASLDRKSDDDDEPTDDHLQEKSARMRESGTLELKSDKKKDLIGLVGQKNDGREDPGSNKNILGSGSQRNELDHHQNKRPGDSRRGEENVQQQQEVIQGKDERREKGGGGGWNSRGGPAEDDEPSSDTRGDEMKRGENEIESEAVVAAGDSRTKRTTCSTTERTHVSKQHELGENIIMIRRRTEDKSLNESSESRKMSIRMAPTSGSTSRSNKSSSSRRTKGTREEEEEKGVDIDSREKYQIPQDDDDEGTLSSSVDSRTGTKCKQGSVSRENEERPLRLREDGHRCDGTKRKTEETDKRVKVPTDQLKEGWEASSSSASSSPVDLMLSPGRETRPCHQEEDIATRKSRMVETDRRRSIESRGRGDPVNSYGDREKREASPSPASSSDHRIQGDRISSHGREEHASMVTSTTGRREEEEEDNFMSDDEEEGEMIIIPIMKRGNLNENSAGESRRIHMDKNYSSSRTAEREKRQDLKLFGDDDHKIHTRDRLLVSGGGEDSNEKRNGRGASTRINNDHQRRGRMEFDTISQHHAVSRGGRSALNQMNQSTDDENTTHDYDGVHENSRRDNKLHDHYGREEEEGIRDRHPSAGTNVDSVQKAKSREFSRSILNDDDDYEEEERKNGDHDHHDRNLIQYGLHAEDDHLHSSGKGSSAESSSFNKVNVGKTYHDEQKQIRSGMRGANIRDRNDESKSSDAHADCNNNNKSINMIKDLPVNPIDVDSRVNSLNPEVMEGEGAVDEQTSYSRLPQMMIISEIADFRNEIREDEIRRRMEVNLSKQREMQTEDGEIPNSSDPDHLINWKVKIIQDKLQFLESKVQSLDQRITSPSSPDPTFDPQQQHHHRQGSMIDSRIQHRDSDSNRSLHGMSHLRITRPESSKLTSASASAGKSARMSVRTFQNQQETGRNKLHPVRSSSVTSSFLFSPPSTSYSSHPGAGDDLVDISGCSKNQLMSLMMDGTDHQNHHLDVTSPTSGPLFLSHEHSPHRQKQQQQNVPLFDPHDMIQRKGKDTDTKNDHHHHMNDPENDDPKQNWRKQRIVLNLSSKDDINLTSSMIIPVLKDMTYGYLSNHDGNDVPVDTDSSDDHEGHKSRLESFRRQISLRIKLHEEETRGKIEKLTAGSASNLSIMLKELNQINSNHRLLNDQSNQLSIDLESFYNKVDKDKEFVNDLIHKQDARVQKRTDGLRVQMHHMKRSFREELDTFRSEIQKKIDYITVGHHEIIRSKINSLQDRNKSLSDFNLYKSSCQIPKRKSSSDHRDEKTILAQIKKDLHKIRRKQDNFDQQVIGMIDDIKMCKNEILKVIHPEKRSQRRSVTQHELDAGLEASKDSTIQDHSMTSSSFEKFHESKRGIMTSSSLPSNKTSKHGHRHDHEATKGYKSNSRKKNIASPGMKGAAGEEKSHRIMSAEKGGGNHDGSSKEISEGERRTRGGKREQITDEDGDNHHQHQQYHEGENSHSGSDDDKIDESNVHEDDDDDDDGDNKNRRLHERDPRDADHEDDDGKDGFRRKKKNSFSVLSSTTDHDDRRMGS